jgi:hypothetical protein
MLPHNTTFPYNTTIWYVIPFYTMHPFNATIRYNATGCCTDSLHLSPNVPTMPLTHLCPGPTKEQVLHSGFISHQSSWIWDDPSIFPLAFIPLTVGMSTAFQPGSYISAQTTQIQCCTPVSMMLEIHCSDTTLITWWSWCVTVFSAKVTIFLTVFDLYFRRDIFQNYSTILFLIKPSPLTFSHYQLLSAFATITVAANGHKLCLSL